MGEHMAKILSFRTPEFRSGYDASRDEGNSAEIILFPGVRYERWGEEFTPHAQAIARDKAQVPRDVLKLTE